MSVHDLETPCVVIDLDRLDRNLLRMQARCDGLGLKFRPHVTTHKIPEIARLQMDAGAVGIAAQKVSEAAVFADAGFNDVLIPYNIVNPRKTARLADLALFNRITVAADHPVVIAGLADAAKANEMSLRVILELATELERTGALPDEVVELAKRIDADENLHFVGLLVYPSTPASRPALQEALNLLHNAGIGVDMVSGGGTGAVRFAPEIPELTELRAGTYIFNDWKAVCKSWADMDDCALMVAATIVSRPTTERAILDCGSRSLSSETVDGGYGFILEYPDAYIYTLSGEHAHVDVSKCREQPVIGERVHVIPVRADMVINLHDTVYALRDWQLENQWSVAARGMVW
jgi:D-serine deaminase-like pyridoxal phosphate-dependent protein